MCFFHYHLWHIGFSKVLWFCFFYYLRLFQLRTYVLCLQIITPLKTNCYRHSAQWTAWINLVAIWDVLSSIYDGKIYQFFLMLVIVDTLIKHSFQLFESLVKSIFWGWGKMRKLKRTSTVISKALNEEKRQKQNGNFILWTSFDSIIVL